MAEPCDLYETLGIEKDSAEADIKKAYRKAALRWHPDKNPDNKEQADAMFKKIAEAYATLSDPDKRALYDKGGMDAVNGGEEEGSDGEEVNPMNIFEQFFEGRDPFADFDKMFDGDFFNSGFGDSDVGDSGFGNDDFFKGSADTSSSKTTGVGAPQAARSRSPRRRVRKKGAQS